MAQEEFSYTAREILKFSRNGEKFPLPYYIFYPASSTPFSGASSTSPLLHREKSLMQRFSAKTCRRGQHSSKVVVINGAPLRLHYRRLKVIEYRKLCKKQREKSTNYQTSETQTTKQKCALVNVEMAPVLPRTYSKVHLTCDFSLLTSCDVT